MWDTKIADRSKKKKKKIRGKYQMFLSGAELGFQKLHDFDIAYDG